MRVGDIVIYKDEQYKILWSYNNGQFEIKKINSLNVVIIAHGSELTLII